MHYKLGRTCTVMGRLVTTALLCMCAWLAQADEVTSSLVLDRAVMTPVFSGRGAGVDVPVEVRLPDAWNKKQQQGLWNYQLQIDLAAVPRDTWAVYIPRAGNRFRLVINGRSIAQMGTFGDPSSDFAQRPHFVSLPAGLLTAGVNRIDITIEGEKARYAGLSRVHIGPDRELRPVFGLRHNVQLGGSLMVVAVCGVFGLLALALFARVRQASDGFFALACFFCAVRTSYAVVEQVPFDFRVWAWFVDMCYAGFVATIVVFVARALSMKTQRWNGIAWVFLMLSLLLVTWHAAAQRSDIRQVWTMVMLVFVTAVSMYIVWQWWRQRTATSAVLAMAASGGVVLGAHDHWLVFYTQDGYGGFALARFALVFFILAMGWIIVDRVVRNLREERAMRESVARELEARKRDLTIEYELNSRLASERAQMVEREKLIQDLHDGMGLQLNSLLGLVEKGDASPGDVQTEVRNSIEQLRTLVDGSETFDGTLAELMGHFRYRIDTRLRRQGIVLNWSGAVGNAPARVRPSAAISLQRLVFELCTNVIKHASASQVSFTAVVVDDAHEGGSVLRICFQDNGKAVPMATAVSGTGQRSILRRVTELDGTHEVVSAAGGGLTHRLTFPLRNLLVEA